MKKTCMKCGGSTKPKMAKGGAFAAGIPYAAGAGQTDGKNGKMQKGGATKKKYAKGGATSFGMLSVKAGVDKNPKPTAADRIAGAKMKRGGSIKKK